MVYIYFKKIKTDTMNQNFCIILQTVTIYLLMILSLRLFGKKELAQLSIIDLVFILLISNAVQNAMVGSLTDFTGGLCSAGALFAVNFALKTILYRNEKLSKFIDGEPLTLIYDGKIIPTNLKEAQISMNELEAAVREHGCEHIEDVSLAILEIDGNISVLSHDFSKKSKKKRRTHKGLNKQ